MEKILKEKDKHGLLHFTILYSIFYSECTFVFAYNYILDSTL